MTYDDTLNAVRELCPADAALVGELYPESWREQLAAAIMASDAHSRPHVARDPRGARGRSAPSSSIGRTAHARRPRPHRVLGLRGRPAIISTLGVAGLAAVLVVALTGSAVRPPAARAVVAFRAADDGAVVATVTDPFAAESELRAAFAAHGFDITVNLLPVSPSLVGTVVYVSGDGISPLQGGHCVTGGGGCPIGVRIAADFQGQGAITLGRPAQAGETYESSASVFAQGEPLHCSGLLGSSVAVAATQLQADGYTVTWRADTTFTAPDGSTASRSHVDASPPDGNFVWDALAMSPHVLTVWTQPAPWPDDAAHGAQVNAGC